MTMTIEVVPPGEPTQSQEDVDARAEQQRQVDLEDAQAALEAGRSADLPLATVQAGSERGAAVITAFFPQELTVPAGTKVTWVNQGSDPHVVSMERGVGPHDRENLAPPSVPPESNYDGGFVISGVFGKSLPAQQFSLRFTKQGEYSYVCPIHPGMGGIVRVTG
jgi:plastocyanin